MKKLLVVGSIVVLVAIAFLVRRGTLDSGSSVSRPHGVASETAFSDLDAFFESRVWKRSAAGPVVLIGIDGASWEFIDPLIARGALPNLARLRREGASADLRSVSCYVSPPAWVTMLTGYLPDKTGIYTFGTFDRKTGEFVSVNADDVHVPSIWDVASYGGKKVAVINVPVTYPVRPIRGVMTSGIMTPNEIGPPLQVRVAPAADRARVQANPAIRSYSTVLKTAAGDPLNTFLISLYDTHDNGVTAYDRVFVRVLSRRDPSGPDENLGSHTFGVGDFSPWVKIRAARDGEVVDGWCKLTVARTAEGGYKPRVSPTLFRIEGPYVHPQALGDVLERHFGYYMPSKLLRKEMVQTTAEDAAAHNAFFYRYDDWDLYHYVFTQSDNIHHVSGFTPEAAEVYRTIDRSIGDIVELMPDNATLIISSDHGFREYTYGIDLNRYFSRLGLLEWKSAGNIDYRNTLVFHNLWHLYLNYDLLTRDELGKRGLTVPDGEEPVVFFVKHLRAVGRALQSPDGNAKFPLEFTPLGGTAGDPPDMLVRGTYDNYMVDFWNLQRPQPTVIRKMSGDDRFNHTREGIFLAWGKGVRKGYDAGVKDIQDVAPTILYLLNLPIARDMDGQIMDDVFEPQLTERTPRFIVDDYAQISRTARDVDRESLEKKLKSLGYIR